MADLYVVTELKAYLIDPPADPAWGIEAGQSIGQDFDAPVSLTVPSIVVDSFDGAPIPRAGEGGTVSLIDTNLNPPSTLAAYLEEAFVDVIVRHRSAFECRQIHRRILGLLQPINAHLGKQLWWMNDLLVEYSTIWRGQQALPYPTEGDTDIVSRVASYRFGCRRKALAGLPYVP